MDKDGKHCNDAFTLPNSVSTVVLASPFASAWVVPESGAWAVQGGSDSGLGWASVPEAVV